MATPQTILNTFKSAGITLADLQKSPTLMKLIQRYSGQFQQTATGQGAVFDSGGVKISVDYQGDWFLRNLAHELGHATGKFQFHNAPVGWNKTAYSFSDTLQKSEGEAIYYEYLVSKELGINVQWTNDTGNVTSQIIADIVTYQSKTNKKLDEETELFAKLGTYNGGMIPSLPSNLVEPVQLNYDNVYQAQYFLNTKLNQDYAEVMGKNLLESKKIDAKNEALFIYNHNHMKSLTNRNHKFFNGRNEDTDFQHDTLKNEFLNGSSVAQANHDFDLLYGGQGNDKIYGNSGKDILLGGDNIDYLYGKGGFDILGGNDGHDTLQGGAGSDILKGGSGFDKYIFELEDISNSDDKDTILDKGANKVIDGVFDTNNRGEIIIAGVSLHKAKWVNKGNGVFQAADQKWQLKLIGTDWEITGMNGSSLKSKIIVKDAALTATAFGLTLPKAASASSRSVSANEHAFLASSISAANNLISAMSAFGVDNVGMADDLNARSAQYHAPLLAASAI